MLHLRFLQLCVNAATRGGVQKRIPIHVQAACSGTTATATHSTCVTPPAASA